MEYLFAMETCMWKNVIFYFSFWDCQDAEDLLKKKANLEVQQIKPYLLLKCLGVSALQVAGWQLFIYSV